MMHHFIMTTRCCIAGDSTVVEKKMNQRRTLQLDVLPCQSEDEWIYVRECFISAFRTYPLYTFIAPDASKRDEFLRRYLEAIYDVGVRNGECLLLCVKVRDFSGQQWEKVKKDDDSTIIGGVIFGTPEDTGGWKCARNEDFEEAYEKVKLKEYDAGAFKRMEEYEDWEYNNITKHICASGVPLWNGAFCAIDPKYAGAGCGTLSYKKCLRYLQHHRARLKCDKSNSDSLKNYASVNCSTNKREGKKQSFKVKLLHAMTILHRRPKPIIFTSRKSNTDVPKVASCLSHCKKTASIFALCHSRRALNFHQNNGFLPAAELRYLNRCDSSYDKDSSSESAVEFPVGVLLMNPFEGLNSDESKKELKKIGSALLLNSGIEPESCLV